MKNAQVKVDYKVLTLAIAGAALSRRAALQMEVAVSLVHFTQESGGADSTGKANLKAVYNGAGYECMAKADRDYKTVNNRLNVCAKLYDKIGSSVVNGWIAEEKNTKAMLDKVVLELAAFHFYTMDDIKDYIGVQSNRSPRQPSAAPVEDVKGAANDAESGAEEAPAPAAGSNVPTMAQMFHALTENYSPAELREFCTKVLVYVAEAEMEAEADKKAA